MSSLDLSVLAWAIWDAEGTALHSNVAATSKPLPASLRRRVTPIGRRALEAAWALCADLDGDAPRIILSSRHGEYDRTQGLLRALADGEDVSPAEFSLAVHHGLAGLLSIATGNRAGHGAVAAGGDTLGAALTEAAACLATGEARVLVMHFDQSLPPDYASVGGDDAPATAFALLLGAGGVMLRLEAELAVHDVDPVRPDQMIGLLRGDGDSAALGGERRQWRMHRAS